MLRDLCCINAQPLGLPVKTYLDQSRDSGLTSAGWKPGHGKMFILRRVADITSQQGWVVRILSHFTHWKKAKIRGLKNPVSNAGSNADPPAGLSFVPAHFLSL